MSPGQGLITLFIYYLDIFMIKNACCNQGGHAGCNGSCPGSSLYVQVIHRDRKLPACRPKISDLCQVFQSREPSHSKYLMIPSYPEPGTPLSPKSNPQTIHLFIQALKFLVLFIPPSPCYFLKSIQLIISRSSLNVPPGPLISTCLRG